MRINTPKQNSDHASRVHVQASPKDDLEGRTTDAIDLTPQRAAQVRRYTHEPVLLGAKPLKASPGYDMIGIKRLVGFALAFGALVGTAIYQSGGFAGNQPLLKDLKLATSETVGRATPSANAPAGLPSALINLSINGGRHGISAERAQTASRIDEQGVPGVAARHLAIRTTGRGEAENSTITRAYELEARALQFLEAFKDPISNKTTLALDSPVLAESVLELYSGATVAESTGIFNDENRRLFDVNVVPYIIEQIGVTSQQFSQILDQALASDLTHMPITGPDSSTLKAIIATGEAARSRLIQNTQAGGDGDQVLNPHFRSDVQQAFAAYEVQSNASYGAFPYDVEGFSKSISQETGVATNLIQAIVTTGHYGVAVTAAQRAALADPSNIAALTAKTVGSGFSWSATPITLYPAGVPSSGDVHQNDFGDCVALSVLTDLAVAQPEAVQAMIASDEQGNFAVSLFAPNSEPVTVTVRSEVLRNSKGELVSSIGQGGQATWLNIFENAIMKYNAVFNIQQETFAGMDNLPISDVSQMLLGSATQWTVLPVSTLTDATAASVFQTGFQANNLFVTSPNAHFTIDRNELNPDHAYSLVAFVRNKNGPGVLIRNPHGEMPQVGDTDTSTGGVMFIPIEQLASQFITSVANNSLQQMTLSRASALAMMMAKVSELVPALAVNTTSVKWKTYLAEALAASDSKETEKFGLAMRSLQKDLKPSKIDAASQKIYAALVDTLYSAYLAIAEDAKLWIHPPGLSRAAIAGAAVGGVAGLAVLSSLSYIVHKRFGAASTRKIIVSEA